MRRRRHTKESEFKVVEEEERVSVWCVGLSQMFIPGAGAVGMREWKARSDAQMDIVGMAE